MYQKFGFATATVAAAALLAACGQNQQGAAPDQQNQPVNAAQDAASAVVGPTSAATVGATVDGFVMNAAVGDMYEIESSRMAMERSKNAAVRKIAQMLITDHTASTTKLKSLIDGGQVTGATLPTAMDERRKGMIDNLRGAPDAEFDNRYLDQQAMAHRETVVLMEAYQTAGQNEPLKAFAGEVAPKIKAHLDMVNAVDRADAPGAAGGAASNTTR